MGGEKNGAAAALREKIEKLDRSYLEVTTPSGPPWNGVDAEGQLEYYGEPVEPITKDTTRVTLKRMGLKGLCLAYARLCAETPGKGRGQGLGRALLVALDARRSPPPPTEGKLYKQRLSAAQRLFQIGSRTFPQAAFFTVEEARRALVDLAAKNFLPQRRAVGTAPNPDPEGDPDREALDQAMRPGLYTRPSEAFARLHQILVATAPTAGAWRASDIEATFLRRTSPEDAAGGANDAVAEEARSADELLEKLLRPSDRAVFVNLHGESYGGKSNIVYSLLAKLAGGEALMPDQASHITLESGGGGAAPIPVATISFRNRTQGDIIEQLSAFFRKGAAESVEPRLGATEVGSTSGEVIERLETLVKDQPAFLIFLDVDALDRRGYTRIIRGDGILRLLAALKGAHPHTRVLLTTMAEPREVDSDLSLGLLAQRAPAPNLRRLMQHLGDRALEEEFGAKLTKGFDGLLFGPVMIAAAFLFRYFKSVPADVLAAVEAIAVARGEHAQAEFSDPRFAEAVDAFLDRFWTAFRARADATAARLVALMAASEDGLLPWTIDAALADWERLSPPATPGRGPDWAESMAALAAAASNRFIRRLEAGGLAATERAFGEEKTQECFSIDLPLRIPLLQAIQRADPQLASEANRLIAAQARRRAALTKLALSDIYGRNRSDFRRDVQCFVALLASLPPEAARYTPVSELDAGPTENEGAPRPIGFWESEIFDAAQTVDPTLALRFCHRVILQQDVDQDHRLTMVFDEDRIRLELLLTLAFGAGRALDFDRVQPRMLVAPVETASAAANVCIPPHLERALRPREIAEFFTSVGIAALFSGEAEVLYWAVACAERVLRAAGDAEQAALHGLLSRLWAAEFDMRIHQARPRRRDPQQDVECEGARRLDMIEAQLDALITEKFSANREGEDGSAGAGDGADGPVALAIGRQRLLVRKMRLKSLQSFDRAPIYRLWRDCLAVEIRAERARMRGALSGRGNRALIRGLLGYPVFAPPCDPQELGMDRPALLRLLRNCISVNAARLSRHSGGDRIGVLIDAALLAVFEGALEAAWDHLDRANNKLFSPAISPQLRSELAWVSAQVCYLIACAPKTKPAEKKRRLQAARTFLRRLPTARAHDAPSLYERFAPILTHLCDRASSAPEGPGGAISLKGDIASLRQCGCGAMAEAAAALTES